MVHHEPRGSGASRGRLAFLVDALVGLVASAFLLAAFCCKGLFDV